jgi:hypothetical protein
MDDTVSEMSSAEAAASADAAGTPARTVTAAVRPAVTEKSRITIIPFVIEWNTKDRTSLVALSTNSCAFLGG